MAVLLISFRHIRLVFLLYFYSLIQIKLSSPFGLGMKDVTIFFSKYLNAEI